MLSRNPINALTKYYHHNPYNLRISLNSRYISVATHTFAIHSTAIQLNLNQYTRRSHNYPRAKAKFKLLVRLNVYLNVDSHSPLSFDCVCSQPDMCPSNLVIEHEGELDEKPRLHSSKLISPTNRELYHFIHRAMQVTSICTGRLGGEQSALYHRHPCTTIIGSCSQIP